MKCPFCNSEELIVIDSRPVTRKNAIRRRRKCLYCQTRFTTFEQYTNSPKKPTDTFDIYFSDLKPDVQKELLDCVNAQSAKEMGWNNPIVPLTVINTMSKKRKKKNRDSK